MLTFISGNFPEKQRLLVISFSLPQNLPRQTVFFSFQQVNMQNVLDPIDLEILRLLQKDATLNNKELAFKLNKSIATVHERIRRLKEQGYIQRIVAILDRKKINRNLIAFSHVFLKAHTAETLIEFETEVAKFSEVMECFQMTGAYDFILRIATSDMDAYHLFLRNKLATLPNVSTVQSFFVLSETKSDTAYPL
ncbi:DNA-binding transcriptional regulator, Lrp family [Pedobacter sp. ok626]|nr:DNA-binding transcriptional regulator, Lrp family [Pedobacter sp. ok626]